jgi:hypothetical protein
MMRTFICARVLITHRRRSSLERREDNNPQVRIPKNLKLAKGGHDGPNHWCATKHRAGETPFNPTTAPLADTWRRPWIECLLRCWTRSNSRKSRVAQAQAHTRFGAVIRNFQRQLSRRARTSKLNRPDESRNRNYRKRDAHLRWHKMFPPTPMRRRRTNKGGMSNAECT